jgi:hypothetical protein
MELLVQEVRENQTRQYDTDEKLYMRFFRKKYKCIIIFFLLIYSFIQLCLLLIQKSDDDMITELIEKNNQTNKSLRKLIKMFQVVNNHSFSRS